MKSVVSFLGFLGLLASYVGVPLSVFSQDSAPDVWKDMQTVERGIPDATGHPGNVFLVGEEVIVQVSPPISPDAVRWLLTDDAKKEIAKGDLLPEQITASSVSLGTLGIGWYRLDLFDKQEKNVGWTTTAVLARLAAPVPQDSPICVDGANAWFAQEKPVKQEQLAQLAALAGVNWIRDRIRWREIQIGPVQFLDRTTYDTSVEFENKHGLKVLQVFHDTPEWVVDEPAKRQRFPEDLRDLFNFCKSVSQRFQGRVQAWEPWNEANAPNFGGHTVDEMCSFQKAAYLGFKAGNTSVTVGWNAYAGVPTPLHTKGVLANETWPYFDTYNIHTYDWPYNYYQLRGPVREAASGRPIWVTESDRGIQFSTEEPWYDLSPEDDRRKAEFIAQSYASSLFAGCNRHFHFILGQYIEKPGNIQFGLLRLDLTPRLGYVALATVGRFLAGAQCLGRLLLENAPQAHVYAFRAKPDGMDRDVLVAWAEKPVDWAERGTTTLDWPLSPDLPILGISDYLGRSFEEGKIPNDLGSEPVFVFLPPGGAEKMPMEKPFVGEYRTGNSVPVVMQLIMSATSTVPVTETPWSVEQEHLVESEKEIELPLYIYNFSDKPIQGTVTLEHLPQGWKLIPDHWEVSLESMGRIALPARFWRTKPANDKSADCWIKLRGDFGEVGKPILAFRLIAFPGEGYLN